MKRGSIGMFHNFMAKFQLELSLRFAKNFSQVNKTKISHTIANFYLRAWKSLLRMRKTETNKTFLQLTRNGRK